MIDASDAAQIPAASGVKTEENVVVDDGAASGAVTIIKFFSVATQLQIALAGCLESVEGNDGGDNEQSHHYV